MRRYSIAAIGIFAGLMLLACSEKSTKSSLNTGIISGHVSLDGQPAIGVLITVEPYVVIEGNPKVEGVGEPVSSTSTGDYRIELPPGTYRLTFSTNQFRGLQTARYPVEVIVAETVTLNVEINDPVPTNLLAIEYDTRVILTFEGGYGAIRYNYYRAPAASEQYELIMESASRRYEDEPPYVGRFKYKVTALNGEGETAPSNVADIAFTGVPLAPLALSATDLIDHISLSWSGYYPERIYNIYRSTPSAGWTLIGSGPATYFSDTPPAYGDYQYHVKTVSVYNIESASAANANVAFDGRLDAPGNFAIDDYGNYLILSWHQAPIDATYRVYRATGGGDYSLLATTGEISYTDRPAANGLYRYQVASVTIDGNESDHSDEIAFDFDSRFDPPTDVSARLSGFDIYVFWVAVPHVSNYVIYRSNDGGRNYERLIVTAYQVYYDTPSTAGDYFYRIAAVTNDGTTESELSEVARIYFSNEVSGPSNISAISRGRSIDINWELIRGTDGYSLFRATALDGDYAEIVSYLIYSNYTDRPDTAGYYYYRVRAFTDRGQISSMSRAAGVNYSGLPLAPSYVNVQDQSYYIQLSWSGDSYPTLYIIYRSNSILGDYVPIDSTSHTSYEDWLAAAGNFYYKIQSEQDGYYSEFSYPVGTYFSARLDTPSMYYCTDVGSQVLVTWRGIEGAERYNLFRGTNRNDLSLLSEVYNYFSYYDTPPQEGWYYYAVSAETRGGLVSQRSDPDSVYFTP